MPIMEQAFKNSSMDDSIKNIFSCDIICILVFLCIEFIDDQKKIQRTYLNKSCLTHKRSIVISTYIIMYHKIKIALCWVVAVNTSHM